MSILTPEHEQFYEALKSSMGITVKLVLEKTLKTFFLKYAEHVMPNLLFIQQTGKTGKLHIYRLYSPNRIT